MMLIRIYRGFYFVWTYHATGGSYMTVSLSVLCSGIAIVVSLFFGILNKKRNEKTDTKEETTQMTTVIIKLESISTGISEIKSELNNVKSDRKEDRDKIIRLEESLKSAWNRINELIQITETLRKEIDLNKSY